MQGQRQQGGQENTEAEKRMFQIIELKKRSKKENKGKKMSWTQKKWIK